MQLDNTIERVSYTSRTRINVGLLSLDIGISKVKGIIQLETGCIGT